MHDMHDIHTNAREHNQDTENRTTQDRPTCPPKYCCLFSYIHNIMIDEATRNVGKQQTVYGNAAAQLLMCPYPLIDLMQITPAWEGLP